MYNEIVLDHFSNPRNVGDFATPDGVGHAGNPIDGDRITIYIKVSDQQLTGVRFKTFGCGAAIAASSMLTVIASGKTLAAALKITNADVATALGGLPPEKLLCSNIAADALHDAIQNYQQHCQQQASDQQQGDVVKNIEATDQDAAPNGNQAPTEGLTDPAQIKRYLRQIIMPEIGGAGQKKLLTTKILVCAPDLKIADLLLRYLVAMGIGQIDCFLGNPDNWEPICENLRDLNPDISLQLVKTVTTPADFNLIQGNNRFCRKLAESLLSDSLTRAFTPTLVSVYDAWQGCFNYCYDQAAMKLFLDALQNKGFADHQAITHELNILGSDLSAAFSGTLLPIELAKACLNIGEQQTAGFYFDLISLIFDNQFTTSQTLCPPMDLSQAIDMNKLRSARILTVGAGGLGCPANLVLAKAGLTHLSLIDFDQVEISNLNRQILHSNSRIGLLKVESARIALKSINPELNITLYPEALSTENARTLIGQHDLVIDGLDNLPTRYLLNDACYLENKPLIEAGALSYYGQVTALIPDDGPCFRCLFPQADGQTAGSCSETGVLGPVPGVIGVLEAVEAIKQLLDLTPNLTGRLLMIDTLATSFDLFSFKKDTNCPLCGQDRSIHELGSFSFVCEDDRLDN
ncbi:ThiF family adenylyltransferase [Acetobacterium wieringae]|uniref:Molybdopterin-synthase adenylyltransferase n=1 Tax=Acetobacterium wieringae TaxID=52694 RepID=A0A1F2PFG5_9FIRM|nr:ThiF family adenylyltransferase [Acetobacterium wieringae]OFV69815.1 molybdopterin-synthase adenylyltransferase [Acetobacterium wieringae]